MTESERATIREMNGYSLPAGAELIELVPILSSGGECDHAAARVRLPDDTVQVMILGGVSESGEDGPIPMLEARIAACLQATGKPGAFSKSRGQRSEDPLKAGAGPAAHPEAVP